MQNLSSRYFETGYWIRYISLPYRIPRQVPVQFRHGDDKKRKKKLINLKKEKERGGKFVKTIS